MRTCTRCEKRLDDAAEPTGAVCNSCSLNNFRDQMRHSEACEREMTLKMRPGWGVTVFNTCDIGGDDFLHIEVRMMKGKMGIDISVVKDAESDDFLMWIGDKKLVVQLEPVDDEGCRGSGIVRSVE